MNGQRSGTSLLSEKSECDKDTTEYEFTDEGYDLLLGELDWEFSKVVTSDERAIDSNQIIDSPVYTADGCIVNSLTGASSYTLSQVLDDLRENGKELESPVASYYTLTEKGSALCPVFDVLDEWGED